MAQHLDASSALKVHKRSGKTSTNTAVSKSAKASTISAKQPLSEEIIVDSDDEEEDDTEGGQGQEQETIESALPARVTTQTPENADEDESDDVDMTDGEADLGHGTKDQPDKIVSAGDRNGVTNVAAHRSVANDPSSFDDDFRPVAEFVPPKQFRLIETDYISCGRKFDASGLEGKQLVFLTVPSDVSVKKLKELSWQKIQKDEEMFKQKDVTYKLSIDQSTSKKGMRILLPTKEGYKAVHAKINGMLQIQETPMLPSVKRAQPDASTDEQPRKIAKRAQPALRQRFQPIGVIATKPSILKHNNADASTEQEQSTLEIPAQKAPVTKVEKKKSKDKSSKDKSSKEKSSSKEKRHKKSSAVPAVVAVDMDGNNAAASTSPATEVKKKKKKKDKSVVQAS